MASKSKPVRRRLLWSLLGLSALLLVLALVLVGYVSQGIQGGKRVDVSRFRNSAHILFQQQQRADGSVDYVAAIEEICQSEADDNLAVLLSKTVIDESLRPPKGTSFLKMTEDEIQSLLRLQHRVMTNDLLNDQELLILDDWVLRNKVVMDHFQGELEKCSRFFDCRVDEFGFVGREIDVAVSARKIARCFIVRANRSMEVGLIPQAVDDVCAVLQMGNCMRESPFFVDQLIATILDAMSLSAICRLLNCADFKPDDLKKLRQYVGSKSRGAAFINALDFDRVISLDLLDRVLEENVPVFHPEVSHQQLLVPRGWIDGVAVAEAVNERVDKLVKILNGQDYRRIAADYKEWESNSISNSPVGSMSWSDFIPSPKLEATTRARRFVSGYVACEKSREFLLKMYFEILVRENVLAIALASKQHELETNELPNSYSDLKEKVEDQQIIDPFSSEKIIFRNNSGNQVLIYSVGRNGIDDGGQDELDFGVIKLTVANTE